LQGNELKTEHSLSSTDRQSGDRHSGFALPLLVAGTFFMENLDATIITPAIPRMAESFAVQPVDLNTSISAYMLTLGIFIPVSGWMADRFGPRRVFCAAIAVFTIASLLCGLSATLPELVAMRILQGIGGAMMVPVGRLVVLRQTPKEQLIGAIATLTWPALIAPVLGPPLGGLISDHANWRWIFYINLPLGLLALIFAWRLVPNTASQQRKPFDWPGFALAGSGLFCLLSFAELLSRPEASPLAVVALLVIGAGLLAFSVRHFNRVATPMIDLAPLKTATFAVTIWGGSLFRMGVSAVPFLVPIMFQVAFGYSALEAGGMLMAVFAGNLLMKPMTTSILRRFGFRRVLVVNGLVNAISIGLCAAVNPTMPLPVICAILFVGGMARSMQFTALNTIAFADVPQDRMSGANTLFSAVFQLAMGLGIALGAVSWRLGEAISGSADGIWPFRIAFLVVAAISLIGIFDSIRLEPDAGKNVSRPQSGASKSGASKSGASKSGAAK
jgi:EmrB/QacA subfamily drug resistance transporter